MYLKLIKTHVSGTVKGTCMKIAEGHGKKMIADKVAVEIEEEEYNEYISVIKEKKGKEYDKNHVQPRLEKEKKEKEAQDLIEAKKLEEEKELEEMIAEETLLKLAKQKQARKIELEGIGKEGLKLIIHRNKWKIEMKEDSTVEYLVDAIMGTEFADAVLEEEDEEGKKKVAVD